MIHKGGNIFSQKYMPLAFTVKEVTGLGDLSKNKSYWASELIMKLYLGQHSPQSGRSKTLSWKYMYQIGLTMFL